jgi:heterodisulfide reductase subunit A-like polyferredoxin
MKCKPGRVYEVSASEFPVQVTVTAKDLEANQAFVADTVLIIGGLPAGTMPVTVTSNGMAKTYQVDKPNKPKADALSTINGFFPDNAPATSEYEVKLVAASGDTCVTKMSPPMVNPAAAFLTFRVV